MVVSVDATPTNAAATGYSNQKKGVTLSNGYLVVVYANTTTNAKFKYSTDSGVNWTDYSVDIAGWINGSIASYIDSGGTERIVAVWKQSGTGGGRTTGINYVMVGTFNAGRTTITWGSAVAQPEASTSFNYSDIVVAPEGTGGVAHTVRSWSNGSNNNTVTYNKITITSGGVPSWGGSLDLNAGYGVILDTFPSIDIDLSTKGIHVAWSAGTTGAGKGIRYRTASYSAGVWTWATEVEVDNTVYIQDIAYWVNCRWDGTRIVIGGILWTGALRPIKTYESTNFTSFTTRTHVSDATNSQRVHYGSMSIDPISGDIYLFGTNNTLTDVAYYEWIRASNTLGSRTSIETGSYTTPYCSTWKTSNAILSAVFTSGNSSPFTIKYGSVGLNVSPNTPTSLQRTDSDHTVTTPSFSASTSDSNIGQNVKVRFEVWNRARTVLQGSVDSGFSAAPATVSATYSSALAVGQYSVKAFAIDDLGLTSGYTAWVDFDVTQLVTKDETLKWDVRQNVIKDEALLWDINVNNLKDLTLLWDVRVLSQPKDLTLLWDVYPVWEDVPYETSPPTWQEVPP